MPSKIFCASFRAEILRMAKSTAESERFKSSRAKIIFRMIKERSTKSKIRTKF